MKSTLRLVLFFSILFILGAACSFIGDETFITDIEFSPDGTLLAGGASNKTIRIWDARNGRVLKTLHTNDIVDSVAFSPDGKLLAGGAKDLSVTLWNTSDWSKVHVIQHEKPNNSEIPYVPTVVFSPDGRYLIILSNIFGVEIRNTDNWDLIKILGTDTRGEGTVSDDGRYFAVASKDGYTVWVYDLNSFEIVFLPQFEKNSWDHYGIALSPDGKFLATGSSIHDDRGTSLYEIWDMSSGNVIKSWTTFSYASTDLQYSPDGKILTIGDFDVTFWDAQTGQEIQTDLEKFNNSRRSIAFSINALDFSPDGSLIGAGTMSNEYGVWDVKTGDKIWGRVILNK
jgi:WD40 repeat protein